MEHEGPYAAEETLKEYANVNIALNNQQYIESAKRIFLMLNTTSLFTADVSYHRPNMLRFFPYFMVEKKARKSQ